jgi:hypothetical protein
MVNAVPRDIEDLHMQIRAALEECQRIDARIAQATHAPVPGDLYAFSMTATEGIEWAVVLRHSDDAGLWFIVPYDQNPLVGTWDVATSPYSEAGPGTLRCGRGIWARAGDMEIGERSGFLEPDDVRAARLRLGVMVGGDEKLVTIQPEVDDDPDYEEWTGELARAATRLEAVLRAPVPTISVANFSTDWASAPGVPVRPTAPLAAAGSGLGTGPETAIHPSPGAVLARELPGVLVAVREESGVRLLYLPGDSEPVPNVRVRVKGSESAVRWYEHGLTHGVRESVASLDPADSPTILGPRGVRLVLTV